MVEASFTAQDRKFKEWTILYSRVTSGWVSYSWSTSIVSDNMMDLVVGLERKANGETFAAAEVPRSVGAWFVVDDDWDAEGS